MLYNHCILRISPSLSHFQLIADIDECQTQIHDCHQDFGVCSNTEGSYACECKPGFTGDGINCIGMFENGVRVFYGEKVGYALQYIIIINEFVLMIAEDIDECTTNTHDCDLLATCTNTDGSFTCACNEGYTGDGKSCNGSWLSCFVRLNMLKFAFVLQSFHLSILNHLTVYHYFVFISFRCRRMHYQFLRLSFVGDLHQY